MSFDSTPFLQKKTTNSPLSHEEQWNLLQTYLLSNPISEVRAAGPDSPSTLDRSVLLAAHTKKCAAIELLRSEAEHAELPASCSISPSNYEYGLGAPSHENLETTGQEKGAGRETETNPKPGLEPRSGAIPGHRVTLSLDTTTGLVTDIDVDIDTLSDHRSPSFGPRKGHFFSGTISRRRSRPHNEPRASNRHVVPPNAASAGAVEGAE